MLGADRHHGDDVANGSYMLSAEHARDAVFELVSHIIATLDNVTPSNDALTRPAADLLVRARDELTALPDYLSSRWDTFGQLPEALSTDLRLKACGDLTDQLLSLSRTIVPILQGAPADRIPVDLEPILQTGSVRASPRWRIQWIVIYSDSSYNYTVRSIDPDRPLLELAQRIDPTVEVRDPAEPNSTQSPRAHMQGAGPTALPRATDDRSAYPQRALFFSVPQIHRDSLLLHSIVLGHELGHVREWNDRITSSVIDRISADLDVDPPPGAQSPAGVLGKNNVGDLETRLAKRDIADCWAHEFAADAFATLAIGPAAFFALLELHDSDTDSTTHPAKRRRLSYMLDVLLFHAGFEHVGDPWLSNLLNAYHADLQDDLLSPIAPVRERERPLMVYAFDALKGSLSDISAAAAEAIEAETLFSPERWKTEVLPAAERLRVGIPVGERWDDSGRLVPTGNRAILNAAWVAKLKALPSLAEELGFSAMDSDAYVRTCHVLDELVLKSMEVARWRSLVVDQDLPALTRTSGAMGGDDAGEVATREDAG